VGHYMPKTHAGDHDIHCVFLTCLEYEFRVMAGLLFSAGIWMHRAETLDEADFLLTVTEATALLSDTIFLDGTWEDAASMVTNVHPSAAFVIMTTRADRSFWAAARSRGAYDLLERPYWFGEVRRAIQGADASARLFRTHRGSPAATVRER
jgi:DNA-binding NtrC family response regulator